MSRRIARRGPPVYPVPALASHRSERPRALALGPWLALAALVAACHQGRIPTPPGAGQRPGDEGPMPPIAGAAVPPLEPLQVVPAGARAQRSNFPVFTDPGELPSLHMVSAPSGAKTAATDGKTDDAFPLEHTHVRAALHGFMAEVEVTQTYKNPADKPIEAIYVFPLPENSAVNHMRMQIGERVVEAHVEERGEARRTYERAKREGYTAALLEQERPNVFTQSVANIEPGKKIDVTVRYVQDLSYDAGEYEFVFPMVVGPRFIQPQGPAPGLAGPSAPGTGTYVDTPAVPDASRITPPIYGRGERPGHDISIEVVADAGSAVSDVVTPTHEVVVRRPADGTIRLTLAEKDSLPNRDFVLRYRAAGPLPSASLLTSGGTDGYFSLVVHPPDLEVDELVGQRELVFVVDVSGSMRGKPLAMCQDAMRQSISVLRPVDTFNVITFSGATAKLFPRARPANADNVREALAFVERMVAGGGTYMLDAVSAALSPDIGDGRNRYVFFMTDGYVGMDDQITGGARSFVARIEAEGHKARVFGFGVGSSVNRNLIEGLSREGKGLAVYASNREDPGRAVNQFFRYIDRSVLRNVRVDWGDLAVSDVMPAEVPDLFASHPLIIHGRYHGTPPAGITVRAESATGPMAVAVTVSDAPADAPRAALGSLWARSKIAWLEPDLIGVTAESTKREITALGLEHHLLTRFTSFVAVDVSKRVGDGRPDQMVQPVVAPEGVDATIAGARPAPTTPTPVPAGGRHGEATLGLPPEPAPVQKPPLITRIPNPSPKPAPPPDQPTTPYVTPTQPFDQVPPQLGGVVNLPAGQGDGRRSESMKPDSEPGDGEDEERALENAPAPPSAGGYGKRGCHCSVVASPSGDSELGWLMALVAGGAVALRMRRRR